ncbi:hypothetical protein ES707_06604 [subsurface metagenome]
MLSDVVKIFLSPKLGKLLTIRVDHSYLAIVEVYLVILVHLPHIICPMLVDIPNNEVNIFLIFKHYIIKKPKGNFAELHPIFPCLYNSLPLVLVNHF